MDDCLIRENRSASLLPGTAEIAIMDRIDAGTNAMKSMSAKDAKNAFGMLIDNARAEPVAVEKHGRKVVVVMAFEEFERLKTLEQAAIGSDKKTRKSAVE